MMLSIYDAESLSDLKQFAAKKRKRILECSDAFLDLPDNSDIRFIYCEFTEIGEYWVLISNKSYMFKLMECDK